MKKMMKRASALLLALALVLGLCACGAADTPAAPVDTKPQDAGEVPAQNEEIVTLKIWGFDYTSTSEDLAMVSEAVSAITREKIGVNVEITRQGDGEMLNLALLSGEQWDLVNYHTYSGGLSALVNNGLRWGELDPAEALPKFNEELYAAGLQTIIDAKQEQLDAFLGKLYSTVLTEWRAEGYPGPPFSFYRRLEESKPCKKSRKPCCGIGLCI